MGFFDKSKLQGLKKEEDNTVKPKVMIVDDESGNLLALSAMLEDEYDILQASDGKEALDIIREMDCPESICLIISDQRMPRMSGTELFRRLIPIIPNTVRILLTAYTDVRSIMDSINEAKIYKFMVKPFDPDELLITIRRAVENYEQGRALVKSQNSIEEQVAIRTRDLEAKNQALILQNQQLQQSKSEGLSGKSIIGAVAGAKTREFIQTVINSDIAACKRIYQTYENITARDLGLIFYFVEIDGIQSIASEYGSPSIVLLHSQLVDLLREKSSASDFVVEWSESVFMVACRYANRTNAASLAEQFHQAIGDNPFEVDVGKTIEISSSISVVSCPLFGSSNPPSSDVVSWTQVLDCGEHALKAVQRAGGNCWIILTVNDEISPKDISQNLNDELASAIESKHIIINSSKPNLSLNWQS